MTRGEFTKAVMKGLGVKWTLHVRRAMMAEAQAEGGFARNNPFNTTLWLPESSDYNWVGVKNYTTPEAGIAATIRTLKEDQPGYALIRKRLRENASAPKILEAIGKSSWGTDGKLAKEVLADIKADRQPLADLEAKRVAS